MTAKKMLDTAEALARAASTLDEALKIAKVTNDGKVALEAANGWLIIAALLDPDTSAETKQRIGFYHDGDETGQATLSIN